MTDLVTTELRDGVAAITLDDGKANALSHDAITALDEALDKAEAEAAAVALFGREGKFSAGFDLNVPGGYLIDIRAAKFIQHIVRFAQLGRKLLAVFAITDDAIA